MGKVEKKKENVVTKSKGESGDRPSPTSVTTSSSQVVHMALVRDAWSKRLVDSDMTRVMRVDKATVSSPAENVVLLCGIEFAQDELLEALYTYVSAQCSDPVVVEVGMYGPSGEPCVAFVFGTKHYPNSAQDPYLWTRALPPVRRHTLPLTQIDPSFSEATSGDPTLSEPDLCLLTHIAKEIEMICCSTSADPLPRILLKPTAENYVLQVTGLRSLPLWKIRRIGQINMYSIQSVYVDFSGRCLCVVVCPLMRPRTRIRCWSQIEDSTEGRFPGSGSKRKSVAAHPDELAQRSKK